MRGQGVSTADEHGVLTFVGREDSRAGLLMPGPSCQLACARGVLLSAGTVDKIGVGSAIRINIAGPPRLTQNAVGLPQPDGLVEFLMSLDKEKSSLGFGGTVAAVLMFLALPLLYFLSTGPVERLYQNSPAPEWLVMVYWPIIALQEASLSFAPSCIGMSTYGPRTSRARPPAALS